MEGAMIVALDKVFVIVSVLVNSLEDACESVNVQLALKRAVVGMTEPTAVKCFKRKKKFKLGPDLFLSESDDFPAADFH
jgi:hypothetical protein